MASYIIRNCEGNKECWYLAALREDGTEATPLYFNSTSSPISYSISYSIDKLVKSLRPGDTVTINIEETKL